MKLKQAFIPFGDVTRRMSIALMTFWILTIFAAWSIYGLSGETHLFPTLSQVGKGFIGLWNEGLMEHLGNSLALCAKAISITTVVSLSFAYLSTLPFMKPLATWMTKFRYLPLTGISFYITMLITDARTIQVWILVIFVSTFLTTGLMSMINKIPNEEHYHARALGHSRWRVLWDVVIIGRLDYVLEVIRQNLAISWMMLVTVESILASAGGLGFLIKNSDKFMNHGRIVALQIIILLTGLFLDLLIDKTRKLLFPYSRI